MGHSHGLLNTVEYVIGFLQTEWILRSAWHMAQLPPGEEGGPPFTMMFDTSEIRGALLKSELLQIV